MLTRRFIGYAAALRLDFYQVHLALNVPYRLAKFRRMVDPIYADALSNPCHKAVPGECAN
ncbi:MAG: hypothetical protein ACE5H0_10830 [Bacteroidota bacterium]